MSDSSASGVEISEVWIDNLLALSTSEEQATHLREANLLDEAGLSRLLDVAERLVERDLNQAERLMILCIEMAAKTDAPAIVPRANYFRARVHHINGEFNSALNLIVAAREEYAALGKTWEALRTDAGLMNVLIELGHYQQSLDTGRAMLDALDKLDDGDGPHSAAMAKLLTAFVYQNHGFCYEKIGRYDEALSAYATAEAYYVDLDEAERLADINLNRGLILLHLGQVRTALAAFEAAAAAGAAAEFTLLQAQALVNIGEARLLLGDYTDSLNAFEEAGRLFDQVDAPTEQQLNQRHIADAYLALNLYGEALAAYRETDRLLEDTGMAYERGWVLWGLGSALIARSDLTEAEQMLDQAADLFRAADNAPLLCGVMLEQAALLAVRGEETTARQTAQQALALVIDGDWPVQRFYAHLRLADLLLPDVEAAEAHLVAAQQLAGSVTLPHLHYRLNQRLGHVRCLQGRSQEAQTLLRAAVDEIERLRGNLAQEAMRTSFLHDKVAAYEALVQLYLDDGGADSVERAWTVAERAKSRALVDLLTGLTTARPAVVLNSELTNRLETLQTDLNAIYNELLGYGPSDESQSGPLRTNLQERAVEVEQEISRLRLQAATTVPTADPLALPLPLPTVQHRLPPELILLTYYIAEDEILAFMSAGGQIRLARRLSTVPIVRRLTQRLSQQWDRFRAGQAFARRHMALLEQSARRLLANLYEALVAPLEPFLAELTSPSYPAPQPLAVVPHGFLHQIPFHALFDGQQYLLERFEISYAPSATVLALCQERPPLEPTTALIVGVSDPSIPAVAAEVEAVAQHFSGAIIRLDEQATLTGLSAEAGRYDLLHLACHGLFRADNPMFSALKLHDGWLTAADILGLDLADTLVTLSACESGRSRVLDGDEIIGLTRAFLGAGAATVLVSQWLVQDETTAALMSTWYEQLPHHRDRAAALRTAQLALKATYPHPYYWAPFTLVGQR